MTGNQFEETSILRVDNAAWTEAGHEEPERLRVTRGAEGQNKSRVARLRPWSTGQRTEPLVDIVNYLQSTGFKNFTERPRRRTSLLAYHNSFRGARISFFHSAGAHQACRFAVFIKKINEPERYVRRICCKCVECRLEILCQRGVGGK